MRCLCCAKLITSASEEEQKNRWHRSCVRKFFETDTLPSLELSDEKLEELAKETVTKGLTVTGVQKKLSLCLSKGNDNRLTIVNYPSGYILKPQSTDFDSLPEMEAVAMRLADIAGIQTVPHALIECNGVYAYITKRIDRKIKKNNIELYAMEDFCQLANRLTRDKYKGSYERCARIIMSYSSRTGYDLSELYMRLVFSYMIGNSDMHLKNFSLIETKPGNRDFVLSRAYDFLSVNIVMPEDKEEMALTLNRKKRNVRKKDFITFANYCGITNTAATKIIQNIISKEEKYIECICNSELNDTLMTEMCNMVRNRIQNLR